MCDMPPPYGRISCLSYIISAETGLPLRTIVAHVRRPNSFESSWYLENTFTSFDLSVSPSVFDLPSDWTAQYRNANNGSSLYRSGLELV